MSVIGQLRRSALGAGGVALLLPLGLALGVALTAALGGEARLRALGQVVAGPDAPDRARAPGLESARAVPPVPIRATPAVGPSKAPNGSVSPPTPGGDATPPSDPEPTRPEPATPSPPQSEPTPPTEPTPSEPQEPSDSPLHDAAQDTADAVANIPVVGEVTDDAMQTVVDLIP